MCSSLWLCRCCAISGKFLLIDILWSQSWYFFLLELYFYVLVSLLVSLLYYEELEDTKGVIKICKSKGQTTQWPKEKGQKDKERSTKHTYKTKDRVTRTSLNTRGELRFYFWLSLYIYIASWLCFLHSSQSNDLKRNNSFHIVIYGNFFHLENSVIYRHLYIIIIYLNRIRI